MTVSIGFNLPGSGNPQDRADVAVVMPTMIRPEIKRALDSVFAQDFRGRVQLLLGVDLSEQPDDVLLDLLKDRPSNISACVVRLPYSTSLRHGGLHTAQDGGVLRTILSFMANSRHVAYLDDDNEWLPGHLSALNRAIEGKSWAFSHRIVIDAETGRELGLDRFDSVGVDKGRLKDDGGFVDPNCLMLDSIKLVRHLWRWSTATERHDPTGQNPVKLGAADRQLFASIRTQPHGVEQGATVRYFAKSNNILHRLFREAEAG